MEPVGSGAEIALSEGEAMNTLWTVVTITFVVVVVAVVAWTFLIAPIVVPRRAPRH
jgi:hypothetical protein